MRIELPPGRELHFQGLRGSKKRHILSQFLEEVQKALRGDIFASFCCPRGGPFWKKKRLFLESDFLTIFGQREEDFWQAPAEGAGPV